MVSLWFVLYLVHYELKRTLQDLVPLASSDEIDSALSAGGGEVDAAAQHLLGKFISLL